VAVQGFFESGGDVSDSTNPSEDVLDAPWAGTETTEIPAGKILVHNAQGPHLLDAAKWPALKVDAVDEESAQLTQEEDLMDNNQLELSTEDENSQGWVSPVNKKKSKSIQRRVVVATRARSTIPRDGIPIATKAMQRAKDRDKTTASMTSNNPFRASLEARSPTGIPVISRGVKPAGQAPLGQSGTALEARGARNCSLLPCVFHGEDIHDM